ncbi:MAG: UDP-N-acetylmuramoyl-L-alanyl-D-glutamate--2,6-diaminopimelate ligase [Bacteroidetes bacterium 4572_117]|nr:MAG: UDP-N-acetylmuramoyl-L-alanyl-D-glutamate--2,6-diaminopimelate ligase [Bacteroidetes bacterium 4572_117]
MIALNDILAQIKVKDFKGDLNVMVSGIDIDSRKVKQDDVFVAVRGTKVDGHQFINKAIDNKAIVIICEELPEIIKTGISYVVIENTAKALAYLVANFYKNPSAKLKIIGVTGTNGKTTVASLLFRLFNNMGFKSSLISTVGYYIGDKKYNSTHTTPDAIKLNQLFSEMLLNGCEYCFMEVSSHAIDQYRVEGIDFEGVVFTNLTHDHLDYHKTFNNYRNTKKRVFDNLGKASFALVNTDDKNAMVMLQNTKAKKYTYSLKHDADYKAKVLESHLNGTLMSLNGIELWTLFAGRFNALNLTAVYAVADLLCGDREGISANISGLKPVSGRFETINIYGITGIVDYAHTPDALENVLATINSVKAGGQQLISVVGAGGDRDKTKRPIMARVAVENSDKVILTSDNPRTEAPTAIIDDMETGIVLSEKKKVLRITDRREAIKTACFFAKKNDIILIAGKGHENYQEIDGVRYDFDDKQVFLEQMEIINN